MLRFAVVDDSPMDREQMLAHLQRYGREWGRTIEVTQFTDGDELVEQYKCQFDLILLDVKMQFLDGMEAAREIRRLDSEVAIIFVTSLAQYAIQGYSVDALDYVLKPVKYFPLSHSLDRAVQRIGRREKAHIMIPVKGGGVKVPVDSVYYVESQGKRLIYHTASGDHAAQSGSIQQTEQELEGRGFFRSNKGYLVNLEHVDGVCDGCAVVNGERLLISRRRMAAFLDALTGHISGVGK